MTSSLWIMRHGQATPGRPDAARQLSDHGRQEVMRMAEWLAESLGPARFAELRIVSSPYVRAQQTAAIVAERLDKSVETLGLITPDDGIEPVIDWLQTEAEQTPWLLVSHMPLVASLAGRLIDGDPRRQIPMPTAAIAVLEADVWAAGCAELRLFHHPADVAG